MHAGGQRPSGCTSNQNGGLPQPEGSRRSVREREDEIPRGRFRCTFSLCRIKGVAQTHSSEDMQYVKWNSNLFQVQLAHSCVITLHNTSVRVCPNLLIMGQSSGDLFMLFLIYNLWCTWRSLLCVTPYSTPFSQWFMCSAPEIVS